MPSRMGRLAGVAVAMVGTARARAAVTPVLSGSAAVDPSQFRVTAFATGLDYPTSMQEMSDGSLLVGAAATNTSYFSAAGELLRFTDANHDGVADGPPTVLASGLPAAVTSVRLAGNLAFVTSAGGGGTPAITVLRQGATPADPFTTVGSVQFNFPAGWEHETYALAARATPGVPGSTDVVFNVGSQNNATAAAGGTVVTTSGLVSASLNEASLYLMRVTDTGSTVAVSPVVQQVASGLRNAAGIAFAANGDLLFEDNGIDGTVPHNGSVAPLSADELNRITAATLATDLATNTVPSFGFPDTYVRYSDGQTVGTTGTPPAVAFLPAGGVQTVGPNEIAVAPAGFGAGLNDGVFVGFHGEFDNYGTDNDENGVAFADPDTGTYVHLIDAGQATLGHPDGLLSTADSLFVSDLGDGSLYAPDTTGAIYEITAVPEPAAGGMIVGAAIAAWGGSRRRRAPSPGPR